MDIKCNLIRIGLCFCNNACLLHMINWRENSSLFFAFSFFPVLFPLIFLLLHTTYL